MIKRHNFKCARLPKYAIYIKVKPFWVHCFMFFTNIIISPTSLPCNRIDKVCIEIASYTEQSNPVAPTFFV
jgi:hypothetical protein